MSNIKNKVVEFKLAPVMKMPDMVKIGYQRAEVTALFTELQQKSFGLFVPGSRGKANCAYFEFFVDLPSETYSMSFAVQKLHSNYMGKPKSNSTKVVEAYNSDPKCPGIKKTSLVATKYSLVIDGAILRAQLSDNGANSIEEAVNEIWDQIEGRINEPSYRNMTAKEVVTSKLMGRGIYNLL